MERVGMDTLVDFTEVARLIKSNPDTISQLVRAGFLPRPDIERRPRKWRLSNIVAWKEAHEDWVEATGFDRRRIFMSDATYKKSAAVLVGKTPAGFVTVTKSARRVKTNPRTIISMIRGGVFPKRQENGLVVESELARWMEANRAWVEAGTVSRRLLDICWDGHRTNKMRVAKYSAEKAKEDKMIDEMNGMETEEEELEEEDEVAGADEVESEAEAEEDAEGNAQEEEAVDGGDADGDDGESGHDAAIPADPVAAIRDIALEAIQAIRAISAGCVATEEVSDDE